MIAHPSIEEILYGERGIIVGINACVEAKCVMSALTLIYSAMDAVAGLARPIERIESNSADFTHWVEAYYGKFLPVQVTAMDFWGARCGILHAQTPHSSRSRSGDARILIYRWRDGHRPDDPILADYEQKPNVTVVEIESLVDAFNQAVESFSISIESDPELRKRVEHHVQGLLCYEPWQPVPIVAAT